MPPRPRQVDRAFMEWHPWSVGIKRDFLATLLSRCGGELHPPEQEAAEAADVDEKLGKAAVDGSARFYIVPKSRSGGDVADN